MINDIKVTTKPSTAAIAKRFIYQPEREPSEFSETKNQSRKSTIYN